MLASSLKRVDSSMLGEVRRNRSTDLFGKRALHLLLTIADFVAMTLIGDLWRGYSFELV